MSSNDDEKPFYHSEYYYSIGKAVNELSISSGAKETSISAAKLAGKSLFNTALFAKKCGGKFLEVAPGIIAEMEKKGKQKK